jgi:probable HAF family extracellular repeat protein
MRTKIVTWITALTVIGVLALPGRAAAQHQKSAPYPYILIDLGTLGGPFGQLDGPGIQITPQGIVLGSADTAMADTDYPNFNPFLGGPNPYLLHAFAWHKGVMTDLEALPGNNSSAIWELNGHGVGAGTSETGAIDPLTGWPAENAVLFKDGGVIKLGTLPGGSESQALAINDRGQAAGFSSNGIPDPLSIFGWGTQTRAFLWQDGAMHDLGTLGGPDAVVQTLNARGQVTGASYTTALTNPVTPLLLGEGVPPTGWPTMDPFLWQGGHMQDLGTLGGTLSMVLWMNNRGEVVGQSNLAGDQTYHPFLWDGQALRDLGTLGGTFGSANWINEAGDVVGYASPPGDQTVHAVLWRKGAASDLGVPPGATFSFASSINTAGQVLGGAGSCSSSGCVADPFLWQGGASTDLNTLVAPSALQVTEGVFIDDRGEIAGLGLLPDGTQRVVLLVPAGQAASAGLTSNAPAPGPAGAAAVTHGSPAPCAPVAGWRARLARGPHLPCLRA